MGDFESEMRARMADMTRRRQRAATSISEAEARKRQAREALGQRATDAGMEFVRYLERHNVEKQPVMVGPTDIGHAVPPITERRPAPEGRAPKGYFVAGRGWKVLSFGYDTDEGRASQNLGLDDQGRAFTLDVPTSPQAHANNWRQSGVLYVHGYYKPEDALQYVFPGDGFRNAIAHLASGRGPLES